MKTMQQHAKENRKVSSFWIQTEVPYRVVCAEPEINLHIEDEYCGDRSEIWIVDTDASGIEQRRYNTRYITEIIWKHE
jgi:hypothetical protein